MYASEQPIVRYSATVGRYVHMCTYALAYELKVGLSLVPILPPLRAWEQGYPLLYFSITDLLLFLLLDVFSIGLWSLGSLPGSLLQLLTG